MDRRVLGVWAAVVSLLALVDALGWWQDYADGAHSVGRGLAQTMGSSLTWLPVNISVYLLTVWFPIGRPHVVRAVLIHLAGYLVALCWLSGRMFLFNAMNTIASFVHDDPLRAEEMVVRLSTMLRQSLEHDGSLEVTLREDLEVLSAYVDIEQARFEDRLAVEPRPTAASRRPSGCRCGRPGRDQDPDRRRRTTGSTAPTTHAAPPEDGRLLAGCPSRRAAGSGCWTWTRSTTSEPRTATCASTPAPARTWSAAP